MLPEEGIEEEVIACPLAGPTSSNEMPSDVVLSTLQYDEPKEDPQNLKACAVSIRAL